MEGEFLDLDSLYTLQKKFRHYYHPDNVLFGYLQEPVIFKKLMLYEFNEMPI